MKKIRVGVIAAAGKGTRAYPRTGFIPKPLFEIESKSILERNVELLVKTFGVGRIFILVGHLKEQVLAEIQKIKAVFPLVQIEPAPWTEKGLAADVASLAPQIKESFLTILGDEFYYKTDHQLFLETLARYPNLAASIGVVKTTLLSRIRKNYSVELKGDQIVNLVEKPENPPNQILGLGSYLFTPEYFRYFAETPISPKSKIVEITDVIDKMAKESTGGVFATKLSCTYFNINSMQDYHHAVYEVRNDLFPRFKTSLVIPTQNNERSISDVLVDFKGKVKEIIIVDNASQDKTVESARKEKASVIDFLGDGVQNQIGEQVRRGIEKADGDIIVAVAPDGSFRSKDFPKLMEYMKDSDMVIGTRTTRQMIEQGSNLKPLPRLANLIMGKMIEIFWWGQEPRFTDANCEYFAIWKESFLKIRPRLSAKDDQFIAEFMIEIVKSHMRCIEIPVSYYKPVENSRYSAVRMFMELFRLILLVFKKKFAPGEK